MEPTMLLSLLSGGLQLMQQEDERRAKALESAENKKLADAAAADALRRGAQKAGAIRMQGSQLEGAQQVAYAASGVDPSVGTPLDVMSASRMFSELDALTAENNAAREAWGYRKHGLKYQQQAALDESRAQYAQAGTLLGTAGRVAAQYEED